MTVTTIPPPARTSTWKFMGIAAGRLNPGSVPDVVGVLALGDTIDVLPFNTGPCPALDYDANRDHYVLAPDPNINPYGVDLERVNPDAHRDVVLCDFKQSRIDVVLGKGDGTLARTVYRFDLAPQAGPQQVLVVDVNDDGKRDIITTTHNTDNITVLLNESSP